MDRHNEHGVNTLESHSTDLGLSDEDYTPTISIQPQLSSATRRPVPILRNWESGNVSQFIPMHGLDFLSTVEQVNIQQTIELNELLAHEESENRYSIKVPNGETIYYASEISSSFQRTCFGASRSFVMKLYDRTHQEALEIKRRLACGTCSFWCYLQALEVFIPHEELIGTVKQQMNFNTTVFLVFGKQHEVLYRIEGPSMIGCLSFSKDGYFKICSSDGMTQVGSINRQWDQVQMVYNLCIKFPSSGIDTKRKALILAAGFLLEYMYFVETGGCKCSC